MSKKGNKETYYANRGVKRNKKPLANKVYEIELTNYNEPLEEKYDKYKFKDFGYIQLLWWYEGDGSKNFHGFITVDKLKELIGVKQYAKFCNGKRTFIIQRRIDNKNI